MTKKEIRSQKRRGLERLEEMYACQESMRWVKHQPSLEAAWANCPSVYWMTWILSSFNIHPGLMGAELLKMTKAFVIRKLARQKFLPKKFLNAAKKALIATQLRDVALSAYNLLNTKANAYEVRNDKRFARCWKLVYDVGQTLHMLNTLADNNVVSAIGYAGFLYKNHTMYNQKMCEMIRFHVPAPIDKLLPPPATTTPNTETA